jgi:membrane-bound metal-dependent hydrolase YbcI (DUF457 family)
MGLNAATSAKREKTGTDFFAASKTIGTRTAGSALIFFSLIPILAIDLYFELFTPGWFVIAILDETAHILTSFIFLIIASQWVNRWIVLSVLAGTILIDVDHIPLLLSTTDFSSIENRPVTHSVLPVLLLILPLAFRRCRDGVTGYVFLGLVAGVVIHLFRDLATGGIPLLWPFASGTFEIRYFVYVLTCVLLGLIPLVRSMSGRNPG